MYWQHSDHNNLHVKMQISNICWVCAVFRGRYFWVPLKFLRWTQSLTYSSSLDTPIQLPVLVIPSTVFSQLTWKRQKIRSALHNGSSPITLHYHFICLAYVKKEWYSKPLTLISQCSHFLHFCHYYTSAGFSQAPLYTCFCGYAGYWPLCRRTYPVWNISKNELALKPGKGSTGKTQRDCRY